MKIVYLSSEVFPFSKTGGLADVANSLPKELNKEHNCIIFTIKYKDLNLNNIDLKRLFSKKIFCFGREIEFSILTAILPESNVRVFFIENDYYYNREGFYQDNNNIDYHDNDERFIFFCRSILEALKELNFKPDIIHANDWQTALAPVYLKTMYSNDPFYKKIRSILTIHNIGYQGLFPPKRYWKLGISYRFLNSEFFEFYGKINFLKAGIIFSDIITTVSPSYAKEIQTQEYGFGLDPVLKKYSDRIFGILNGIDYTYWNPELDSFLKYNYNIKKIKNKYLEKKELQKDLGFIEDKDIPIFSIISRLDYQKGFDLFINNLKKIITFCNPVQIIILGVGNKEIEDFFRRSQQKFPANIRYISTFNEKLAHRIYAASDFILIPSRYEPCGLTQMIAMKYLTVPIVRFTGGLNDTVLEYSIDTGNGDGFGFVDFEDKQFVGAIKRAYKIRIQPRHWKKLLTNLSKIEFSWESSAKKYLEIYKKSIKYQKSKKEEIFMATKTESLIHPIGSTAGEIYKYLEKQKNNTSTLANLKKATKQDANVVAMAIGWLSRENNVIVQKTGRSVEIKLNKR